MKNGPAAPGPRMESAAAQPVYTDTIREWQARAPWYRRWLARIGLQGKLIIGFTSILAVALCGSYWMFARESSAVVERLVTRQAMDVCNTLALASQTALERRDNEELSRVGIDLL